MPLAPRTLNEYHAVMRRLTNSSFSGELGVLNLLPRDIHRSHWEHLSNSGRLVMRAALRWAYREAGQEEAGKEVAAQILLQKEVKRVKKNPTRSDVEGFVNVAKTYPAPWRELLLINVAMGFRRDELLALDRTAVEKALSDDEKILRFVRKGMLEDELPISHVTTQFKVLLKQASIAGRSATLETVAEPWTVLWQVIGTSYRSAYERLKRTVSRVAKDAGCSTHWTPHVMRHAFASEMARDGASLPAIQEALNHASYQTTLRYVHVDARDLTKWMKPRGDE